MSWNHVTHKTLSALLSIHELTDAHNWLMSPCLTGERVMPSYPRAWTVLCFWTPGHGCCGITGIWTHDNPVMEFVRKSVLHTFFCNLNHHEEHEALQVKRSSLSLFNTPSSSSPTTQKLPNTGWGRARQGADFKTEAHFPLVVNMWNNFLWFCMVHLLSLVQCSCLHSEVKTWLEMQVY